MPGFLRANNKRRYASYEAKVIMDFLSKALMLPVTTAAILLTMQFMEQQGLKSWTPAVPLLVILIALTIKLRKDKRQKKDGEV